MLWAILVGWIGLVSGQRVDVREPGWLLDLRGGIPGVAEFPFVGGAGFGFPPLPFNLPIQGT